MIEVDGLTVRYGGVTSLDAMSLTFEQGTCGLIGPNGAGKTTFFNVLSGFVRPAAGAVRAFGVDLLSMAHYRRARWGVRRTFQTEQAIEELSVFDNVAMVHEHSRLGGASRRADVLDAITFTGLDADPETAVRTLGAGAAPPGRGRPRRRRAAAAGAAGRARRRAAGRGDQAPGRGDPAHPRAHRCPGHPGRPRHEPGLGLLRDHGRARLRQADRVRPDRRGAPRRRT